MSDPAILLARLREPVARDTPFGGVERAAIDLVARRLGVEDPVLLLAIGLAVWAQRSGHSGLGLTDIDEVVARTAIRGTDEAAEAIGFPDAEALDRALRAAPDVVRVVPDDEPGTADEALSDSRLLVLHAGRLITTRQYVDSLQIVDFVVARCGGTSEYRSDQVEAAVDRAAALPGPAGEPIVLDAEQSAAVRSVVTDSLTVLTGGPGTGKTLTLARAILAFLVADHATGGEGRVAVCAPTGKAATRATEMLRSVAAGLGAGFADLPGPVVQRFASIEATTVHRLLGSRPGVQTRFAHDATNPIPYDLIVVDETSMVAQQLMARLVEAVGPETRVVLVGDPDQLESVESGSVLRDLTATDVSDRTRVVRRLRRTHRVVDGADVARLAEAVSDGRPDRVLEAFATADPTRIRFVESTLDHRQFELLADEAAERVRLGVEAARSGDFAGPSIALAVVAGHKVLCGPRRGPSGVYAWNDALDHRLRLSADDDRAVGRALMVTVNDRAAGLVNGDVGVVVRTPDGVRVAFVGAADEPRLLAPAQLPPFERSFAMTIHKSQGSEYAGSLLVVLPPEDSLLLTRELLYTAVTRAKGGCSVTVTGSVEALARAVETRSVRASAIPDLIAAKLS